MNCEIIVYIKEFDSNKQDKIILRGSRDNISGESIRDFIMTRYGYQNFSMFFMVE